MARFQNLLLLSLISAASAAENVWERIGGLRIGVGEGSAFAPVRARADRSPIIKRRELPARPALKVVAAPDPIHPDLMRNAPAGRNPGLNVVGGKDNEVGKYAFLFNEGGDEWEALDIATKARVTGKMAQDAMRFAQEFREKCRTEYDKEENRDMNYIMSRPGNGAMKSKWQAQLLQAKLK